MPSFGFTQNIMYYSYVEIEYVATSFSPARTDLALKLFKMFERIGCFQTHSLDFYHLNLLQKKLLAFLLFFFDMFCALFDR
jgi:hypothetical protein